MSDLSTPWRDTALSSADRAAALLAAMTLEEKAAQLGSSWPGAESAEGDVAPMQETHLRAETFETAVVDGLGQITRNYGTAPITAGDGQQRLHALQADVIAGNRFGLPAIAHEECLTGVTAWQATVYPTPLAWGATFNPNIIREMAHNIGSDLHDLGVQQGLSPVLDVVRDYRWGRVEETIGEDPYLVSEIGAAYVDGLEDEGIIATPKHFAGYSASRGARNHAPVSIGPRELRDVILPPFERALRRARSVMNAYNDVDGIPAGADTDLLTGILREQWGFTGTVVSDYWAIPFLESMHRIAPDERTAAALALSAGLDLELPHTLGYHHLVDLVQSGELDESIVDRSVERVLRQKIELGMADPGWTPPTVDGLDLNSLRNQETARQVAEQSLVLVHNDSTLPLTAAITKIAIVGPTANDAGCLFGCYSFPNHVLPHHPHLDLGVTAPTYLDAVTASYPHAEISYVPGVSIAGEETDGIDAARAAVDAADIALVFVGDRSGMFGLGTSGEGCDATDLFLPGAQSQLLDAVLESSTPAVVVVNSGRPYTLGKAPARAAAIVQAFFPGQEGADAVVAVLTGTVNPSGRLPVQIPALAGAQPSTYLAAPLALRSDGVSNIDPTPAYPFGHGLSYTTFTQTIISADAAAPTREGTIQLTVDITNTGERAGADVVQIYASRPTASVVQPVRRLIAFDRVPVAAGATSRVTVEIPVELLAYTGRDLHKAVEAGDVILTLATNANDPGTAHTVTLTGERSIVAPGTAPRARARQLHAEAI